MADPEQKVRRRKRPTIVCLRCRGKKSKCDKMSPCSNCIKAKCPHLCVYGKEFSSPVSAPVMGEPVKYEQNNPALEPTWSESIERHLKSQNIANRSDELLSPRSGTLSQLVPNPQVILEGNHMLIGVNPVVRSTDMLNLHMDLSVIQRGSKHENHMGDSKSPINTFKCIRNASRAVSLVEVSQQEPGAKLFWKFNDGVKKLKLMTIQNFSDHQFRNELLAAARATFGPRFIDLYPHALTNIGTNPTVRLVFCDYGSAVGLTITESLDLAPTEDYAGLLKVALPLRDALMGLVLRFFAKIYPMYPVVDEEWFAENLDRLLVYSPDGMSLVDIRIASRDDLTICGMLLFMLRLAYLSYMTNSLDRNEAIINEPQPWGQPLVASQITVSHVELGIRLLNVGRFRKKALFLTLQSHLLYAVTRMYALENEMSMNILDLDCNVGRLLQMATSLTLDRDPDLVHDMWPSDERSKNLRRKVWYVLVRLDLTMSYTFFSPRCIPESQYNTKLPTFSPAGSNITNHTLEEETIRLICEINEVLNGGNGLLDICLDMKSQFRVVDVICKLNDFENLISDKLGWTQNYFRDPNSREYSLRILTVLQLQTQVILKMFLANVYYFLHLYYSYKNDQELDFFFFRKLILIVFVEMNYFCSELMFLPILMSDTTFNLFMSPVILIYLHVVAMVGLGFGIRLHCSVFVMERKGESNVSLRVLKNLTLRNETFVLRKLKLCKLLSERYFYGWKCTKANGFGYRMVYENQLYSTDIEALTKAKVFWSERQQMEIFNLIPEDVPIQMSDVGDVRSHCYYSNRSLNDCDLRGADLSKTIQTDNFWIVFNAITERDPYSATYSKENNGERKQPILDPTPGVSTDVNFRVPQPDSVYRPEFSVKMLSSESPLIGPSASDILDFNFFTTDWSIDEFYPQIN